MRSAIGNTNAGQVAIGLTKSWLYLTDNTVSGLSHLPDAAGAVMDSLENRGVLATIGSATGMAQAGFHNLMYGDGETRGTFLFNLGTAPLQAEMGGMVMRPIGSTLGTAASLAWDASSGWRAGMMDTLGSYVDSYMYRTGGLAYLDAPGVPSTASELAPNRIYSARELLRRVEEPGPFHNFPESFNGDIFAGNRTVISDNYVLYTKEGTITLPGEPIYGRTQVQIGEGQRVREIVGYTEPRIVDGTFEIGVNPSATGRTEIITHRFFRPKGSQ
jgi:hypothetical protein